jgi:hypothetical protein
MDGLEAILGVLSSTAESQRQGEAKLDFPGRL